jgi:hypothetical protein
VRICTWSESKRRGRGKTQTRTRKTQLIWRNCISDYKTQKNRKYFSILSKWKKIPKLKFRGKNESFGGIKEYCGGKRKICELSCATH